MSEIEKFIDSLDSFSTDRISAIREERGNDIAELVAKELERMKLEVIKQLKSLMA